MATKATEKPVVMVKYRVMADCMYNHTWYGAGTILEYPEDYEVKHDMIQQVNGDDVTEEGMEIYDPQAEYQKRDKLAQVMAGIVR